MEKPKMTLALMPVMAKNETWAMAWPSHTRGLPQYYPLGRSETEVCNPCPVPTFVRYMESELFRQILSVLPFDTTDSDNYLILFNISNVLKYWFTATQVWHNSDFEFN